MTYDLAIVIGRFQPFHHGHMATVREALGCASSVLLILGSAHRPRSIRDPWSTDERRAMIAACLEGDADRCIFMPVEDRLYNDQQWAAEVQVAVAQALVSIGKSESGARIVLLGHTKDDDHSSSELFPQWAYREVPLIEMRRAKDLRSLYFNTADAKDTKVPDELRSVLPAPALQYLDAFRTEPHYTQLLQEWKFIRDYQQQFAALEYPPVFVTVDAFVVQSGHVLLVQRNGEPGRGLWALPGGFVDSDERIATAVIRELYEETSINCPEPILRGSVRAMHVFDYPERSLRGRTITNAYLFELAPHKDGLYLVQAGSDAGKARWFPVSQVLGMGTQMFDDHLDIVRYFLGRL